MAGGSEDTIEITKPGILALGADLPSQLCTASLFNDATVAQIACGRDHSAVVLESGQVYVFGKNQDNGWMNKNIAVISPPSLVTSLNHVKVVQVSCGYQFTLFLTGNGSVYTCGRNEHGQLGLGNTNDCPIPQLVPGLPCIKKVAAGLEHSLILTATGEVWSTGNNVFGNLGHKSCKEQLSFVNVPHLPGVIVDIACGESISALLTESGVILMAGCNELGELGLAQQSDSFTPVSTPSVAIAAISCGARHCVCLRTDGSMWAWGSNYYLKLGIGKDIKSCSTPTPVVGLHGYTISKVIANESHTAFLTSEGDVLLCGRGDNGELGTKSRKNIGVPMLLKKSSDVIVKQVAFALNYTLLLIGPKKVEPLAEQEEAEDNAQNEQNQAKTLETVPTKLTESPWNRARVSEMEETMLKSLECPVCFKVMSSPIHLCKNGHSVCASCMISIPMCCMCREPYTNTRSLNLENLCTIINLPYVDCLERMPANLLEKHGEVCLYRKYVCPVQQSCGWRGRPENMWEHTSTSHPDLTLQKLPYLFVLNFSVSEFSKVYLLPACDDVFTLHLKYDCNSGKFQALARYIGPPENAEQYKVIIALIKDDDFDKNILFKNVCGDTEDIEVLYNTSSCVSVNRDVWNTYSQSDFRVTCEVNIQKVVNRNRNNYIKNLLKNL